MKVELLTTDVRLGIAAAAALCGLAAAFFRWRQARARWVVSSAAAAFTCALALVTERVVALLVGWAAPADVQFNEWRWVMMAPWGRTGIWLGVALAAATIALAVRGSARERRPWRRALLVMLRAGGAAAALVLFLEPALELRHVTREPNHIAVLVDDSRSMALAEQKQGPTRLERAARLLSASANTFTRWRKEHHVDFFTFSDSVLPAAEDDLAREVKPRADATQLREALEGIRARYDGHDLAGIVVVSDGTPTGRFAESVDDGASRDFLGSLGARVHTVWAGRNGLRDFAVARVNADEFAFVRTVVKIEAVIRGTGFRRRELPVTLRKDGVAVKQAIVSVGGDTPEAHVTFELTPERIGKYVYEVSIPADEDEAITANNTRAFVIRVMREKLRVLQVAGRPSEDVQFVRGLLEADPNVDLISFFILRTPDDIQLVPPHEMSLIPFPTEELFEQQLGSFDAILLMNFEYGPYGIGPYLENIKKYVALGGGLAMVGGDQSFSSGGYFGSPVADVLPVELAPIGADPGRLVNYDEFHPRLTAEGLRHPVTQLRFEARDNEARWNALPPLVGMNLVLGPTPNASVLAVHPYLKTKNGKAMPVITVGEFGQGRSAAILTDTTWRWGFVAAGRPGDDGRAHQKFWENTLRWLIRDPELEYLHVETDQAAYAPGEAPRVTARLVDKDYRPARGAEITLALAAGTGEQAKVAWEKQWRAGDDGEVHIDLKPPTPGAYRLLARARIGERKVAAEDVFLVNAERAELEHPEAREDVLTGVAVATGGRYLGDVGALDSDLAFAPPRVVRVDRRSDVELWSRPYLFFLALALLGAEWALRRRSGYM